MEAILKICKVLFLIIIMNCLGVTQNDHCLEEFSYLYKTDTIVLNNPKAETFIEKYKNTSIAILYKDPLLVNIYSGGNDTLYYVKDVRTDSITVLSNENKIIGNYRDSVDKSSLTWTKIKCDSLYIDNIPYDCYKLNIINNKMLDSITAYVNFNKSDNCNIFMEQKELNKFNGNIYKFTLYNSLFNVTYIRSKLPDAKVLEITSKLTSFQK